MLSAWSTRRTLALAYAALLAGVGSIVLLGSPVGSTFGLFGAQAELPATTFAAAGAQGSARAASDLPSPPLLRPLTAPGASAEATAPTATSTPSATPEFDLTAPPTPSSAPTVVAIPTPNSTPTPAPTDTPASTPSPSGEAPGSQAEGD